MTVPTTVPKRHYGTVFWPHGTVRLAQAEGRGSLGGRKAGASSCSDWRIRGATGAMWCDLPPEGIGRRGISPRNSVARGVAGRGGPTVMGCVLELVFIGW